MSSKCADRSFFGTMLPRSGAQGQTARRPRRLAKTEVSRCSAEDSAVRRALDSTHDGNPVQNPLRVPGHYALLGGPRRADDLGRELELRHVVALHANKARSLDVWQQSDAAAAAHDLRANLIQCVVEPVPQPLARSTRRGPHVTCSATGTAPTTRRGTASARAGASTAARLSATSAEPPETGPFAVDPPSRTRQHEPHACSPARCERDLRALPGHLNLDKPCSPDRRRIVAGDRCAPGRPGERRVYLAMEHTFQSFLPDPLCTTNDRGYRVRSRRAFSGGMFLSVAGS